MERHLGGVGPSHATSGPVCARLLPMQQGPVTLDDRLLVGEVASRFVGRKEVEIAFAKRLFQSGCAQNGNLGQVVEQETSLPILDINVIRQGIDQGPQ